MLKAPVQMSATQRVVARLFSEEWVNCPNLGFLALCPYPLLNLRQFVLHQLQTQGDWMWVEDLQLAALIFSVPDHEFQIHPHLNAVLKQLELEQAIAIQCLEQTIPLEQTAKPIIFLRIACAA